MFTRHYHGVGGGTNAPGPATRKESVVSFSMLLLASIQQASHFLIILFMSESHFIRSLCIARLSLFFPSITFPFCPVLHPPPPPLFFHFLPTPVLEKSVCFSLSHISLRNLSNCEEGPSLSPSQQSSPLQPHSLTPPPPSPP